MAVDPCEEFTPIPRDSESRTEHIPVLLHEVLDLLAPRSGGMYVDATFGGGGHARAILERSIPDGRLLALDADPEAFGRARDLAAMYGGRLKVAHGNFRDIRELAESNGFEHLDGVLMDLGLSSFQLNHGERGFSFQHPGPLDMRFDTTSGINAADIVNNWSSEDLAAVIYEYGEETRSRAIARAVVREREREPITTTDQLARIVETSLGGRRGKAIHPATRTFQALRIAVNGELDSLRAGLNGAIELLAVGGRLAVISFHSLEDRIVKTLLRLESTDCICPPETPVCVCGHKARLSLVTRRAVKPSPEEERANPRSRSARLRVAERLP